MPKGAKELIDALNEDISYELAAIIQYMWHHVMASGVESPAIIDRFRLVAMDEMRHAEMLAERIDLLGGVPTTELAAIQVGGDLKKMIRDDIAGEELAVRLYKQHIKLADGLDDPISRRMLEDILADEERHLHDWETVLERS
ncbi:MAG: ferritin [Dehalococcoidia bacterium]|nr:MAG: ferritin [Dehalococcoidia bacterium]